MVKILESHIGNDREYEFGLDIGLGFRHVWTRPTYPINNNLLFYFWVSKYVYNSKFSVFKLRIVSLSLIHEKELFRENSPSEIFVHSFLCQRERKRHWVVHRARPCVLLFRVEDHFILGGKRPRVSKHHSESMRGKICFKEIVSNTRLDLNCSSFHAFSLWVFNYL